VRNIVDASAIRDIQDASTLEGAQSCRRPRCFAATLTTACYRVSCTIEVWLWADLFMGARLLHISMDMSSWTPGLRRLRAAQAVPQSVLQRLSRHPLARRPRAVPPAAPCPRAAAALPAAALSGAAADGRRRGPWRRRQRAVRCPLKTVYARREARMRGMHRGYTLRAGRAALEGPMGCQGNVVWKTVARLECASSCLLSPLTLDIGLQADFM
jgi:hypothetical protein